mgnify:CR=1 FL=1
MEVKLVESPADIATCRHLAWCVLVQEQGWQILADNTSGLRIIHPDTRPELADDYEAVAEWMALVEGDEIVGCNRKSGRVAGQFELERYISIPAFLKEDDSAFEHTRLCIAPKYRSKKAMLRIAKFWYEHYRERQLGHFFTTGYEPFPGGMYRQLGMHQEHTEFKYNAHETKGCFIYHFNMRDLQLVDSMIEQIDALIRCAE